MNTTHPQTVKNVIGCLERGLLSRTQIAVQEGIVYNTVKSIEKRFKESGLQGTDLSLVGHSKLADTIYSNRKPDNDGYSPIDYDEVFFWIDVKGYSKEEVHLDYEAKASSQPFLKSYSYSQFCKKLNKMRPITPVNVLDHDYGYAVQVDFAGRKGDVEWIDKNGNIHVYQMFVAVFAASGFIFCYPVKNQQIDNWLLCIEKLFEFTGYIPKVVCSDNLKASVSKPRGPGRAAIINPEFKELSEAHGFDVKPTLPRHPQHNGAAEAGVKCVSRRISKFMARERYFSFEHMLNRMYQFLLRLNSRPFKNSSRFMRFQSFEIPKLKKLKTTVSTMGKWLLPTKVQPTGFVRVRDAYYQITDDYLGKSVIPKVYAEKVEFYFDGQNPNFLIQTHTRSYEKDERVRIEGYQRPSKRQLTANSYQHYVDWAYATNNEALIKLITIQLQLKKTEFETREACKSIQSLFLKAKHAKTDESHIFFEACADVVASDHKTPTSLKQQFRMLKKRKQV